MSPVLLPLIACVTSSVLATATLARDARRDASRLAAAILYGASFWAFCEVLWSGAADPTRALALVKLSALGWVALGPLGLHLMIELIDDPAQALRAKLPRLYATSAVFLALDWTTPWIHPRVVETAWGFGYELGPAYPLYWAFTVSALVWGLVLGARAYRRLPSVAERTQARWVGAGILVPLVVGSVTDGLLPFLGIQVVHLGTPSLLLLGATVAWSLHRYGYALLLPASYSSEIVETMREGLVMLRLDGRIRTANSAMATLAGCSRQALVGVRIQDVLDPDPMAPLSPSQAELQMKPLTGPPFPVSVSTSTLLDREGVPSGSVMVIRDQREVAGLRQRLMLSGRMAAVGQLAAGVAHEINNPVAYVRANLVMLRQHWVALRDLPPQSGDPTACEKQIGEREAIFDEGLDLIDESLEGVARTAAIVRGIREFSHAGHAVRERVDLNDLVDSALRMAAPRLKQANLSVDRGGLPRLTCSPREIQQVILNLLINAADAGGEDGPIRVSTRSEGDRVRVTVSDEGSGIGEAALERIFDPFFTTKGVGEGTGLGLSISYEIVHRHGGEILVDSKPGKGTTFKVYLPVETPPD